jgi:streptogramin lyase
VRPVEDVLVAQLTLTGDPDWLVADEHGLWVFRQSGEFTLVDPAANEVTGTVSLGNTNLCSGIGASFGSVWTCKEGDVVRIDPDAMEVTHRYPVRKQAAQGHLVGGFGHVWVLTGDGSTLVGIDPETDNVAAEYELPARGGDVAMSEDALWLPCRIDDRVLKLDPATGEVLLDIEVANPVTVATGDGEVWVGTATDTQRLDPDTGEVLLTSEAPTRPEGALALDDDSVWVRNAEDFVVEVDRTTGERVRQITAEGLTSSGDMLVLDGDLWVASYDDQVLFHLDPD